MNTLQNYFVSYATLSKGTKVEVLDFVMQDNKKLVQLQGDNKKPSAAFTFGTVLPYGNSGRRKNRTARCCHV